MTYISEEKRRKLLEEYPSVPTAVLSKKYGISGEHIRRLARYAGIAKDFKAQRQYRASHRKKNTFDELLREKILADFPAYTNKELAWIYKKSADSISRLGRKAGLRKDPEARRQRLYGNLLEQYGTVPTPELAAKMGISEEALRRRANRAGLHKEKGIAHPRLDVERTKTQRLILAFAATYTIESIAKSVGCTTNYVYQVIKRAGLTPITEPKPVRSIIQWTLDGQIVNRYPSCRAAARAIGGSCSSSNIWACTKGKVGNKTAYGFRWTEEIINP